MVFCSEISINREGTSASAGLRDQKTEPNLENYAKETKICLHSLAV